MTLWNYSTYSYDEYISCERMGFFLLNFPFQKHLEFVHVEIILTLVYRYSVKLQYAWFLIPTDLMTDLAQQVQKNKKQEASLLEFVYINKNIF